MKMLRSCGLDAIYIYTIIYPLCDECFIYIDINASSVPCTRFSEKKSGKARETRSAMISGHVEKRRV